MGTISGTKLPIHSYLIIICNERLVDHCSLGDDLGSLPRYCIFNVYLIQVWPRSNLASLPGSSGPKVHNSV